MPARLPRKLSKAVLTSSWSGWASCVKRGGMRQVFRFGQLAYQGELGIQAGPLVRSVEGVEQPQQAVGAVDAAVEQVNDSQQRSSTMRVNGPAMAMAPTTHAALRSFRADNEPPGPRWDEPSHRVLGNGRRIRSRRSHRDAVASNQRGTLALVRRMIKFAGGPEVVVFARWNQHSGFAKGCSQRSLRRSSGRRVRCADA